MEIKKSARFITDFYGGRPYLTGSEVIKNWLESQMDKTQHPRMVAIKKALKSEGELEKILSVFNTDSHDVPILGNWMLHECSRWAAQILGTWDRFKVSGDVWKSSVIFTPTNISLHRNGDRIEVPDGVEPYPMTVRRGPTKGNSFFKAYQTIRKGAEFSFTLSYPDDLCTKTVEKKQEEGKGKKVVSDPKKSKECANAVLDKMCIVGLGAYKDRFGKFEWI